MKDKLIFECGYYIQHQHDLDQVKKMDRLKQEGKIKTKKICFKKEIK